MSRHSQLHCSERSASLFFENIILSFTLLIVFSFFSSTIIYDMFVWTKDSTRLLLEEYEKRKHDFRNPANTKKTLWAEIQAELEKYNYNINIEALDKKFRNLKRTYLNIHDNTRKTGAVKWEFYNIFCRIFEYDRDIKMEKALNSISVDIEDENKMNTIVSIDQDNNSTSTSSDENESENAPKKISGITKTVKRKYGFWKDILELEKEKLQEIKKLRMSLEEMVNVQKYQAEIFTEIMESLKK